MKKWIIAGLFYLVFLGSIVSLGLWATDDMDEFGFCLDVVYNGITDDSEVITYCQKKLDDFRAEREIEEKERNDKFLKEFEN